MTTMKILYFFLCAALLHSSQSQWLSWRSPLRNAATTSPVVPAVPSATSNAEAAILNAANTIKAGIDVLKGSQQTALSGAGLASSVGTGATAGGVRAAAMAAKLGVDLASKATNAKIAMARLSGNAIVAGSDLANGGVNMANALGQRAIVGFSNLVVHQLTGLDTIIQNILIRIANAVEMLATLAKNGVDILTKLSVRGINIPNLLRSLATTGPLADVYNQVAGLVRDPRIANIISGVKNVLALTNDPMQMVLAIRDLIMNNIASIPEIVAKASELAHLISTSLGEAFNDIVQKFNEAIQKLQADIASIKKEIQEKLLDSINGILQQLKDHESEILGVFDKAIADAQSINSPEAVQAFIDDIQNRINKGIVEVQGQMKTTLDNVANQVRDSVNEKLAEIENFANTLKEKAASLNDPNLVRLANQFIDLAKQKIENGLITLNQKVQDARPIIEDAFLKLLLHEQELLDQLLQSLDDQMQTAVSNGSVEEVVTILTETKKEIEDILEGRADIKELILEPFRNAAFGIETKINDLVDNLARAVASLLPSIGVNVQARK